MECLSWIPFQIDSMSQWRLSKVYLFFYRFTPCIWRDAAQQVLLKSLGTSFFGHHWILMFGHVINRLLTAAITLCAFFWQSLIIFRWYCGNTLTTARILLTMRKNSALVSWFGTPCPRSQFFIILFRFRSKRLVYTGPITCPYDDNTILEGLTRHPFLIPASLGKKIIPGK